MIRASTYRPDIDGLRAVAVLSVLFYHFGIWPFSGGFVGVDVFFVISGYLITKIILAEAEAGRFSLVGFYTRRARRLLPALLVTIAGAYGAGVAFFSVQDLIQLSRSTIAAVLAVSNIFYWVQADYFDSVAILKPLLHTWSLAVEFQFYLIWPAVLLALSRTRSRGAIAAGIGLAACISFMASLIMLHADTSGAFYLTPFRIHEFAIGGLVVLLEERRLPRWLSDVLFLAGLAAVLASVFAFDEKTLFPGYAALAPSLGTAAMIYAGGSARLAWPLRTAPMLGIGAISYSLYLVHWPLWVFTRYVLARDLTAIEVAIMIAATFGLGIVLYYVVETVFRKPKPGRLASPLAFNLACVAASALIIAPAAASWIGKGWAWRLPREIRHINKFDVQELRDYVWAKHNEFNSKQFSSDRKRVYVIGDSQAADFINMLVEAGQDSKIEIASSIIYTQCGLPFIPPEHSENYWTKENAATVREPSFVQQCKDQIAYTMASPALRQADVVVLAMFWNRTALKYINAAVAEIRGRTSADLYLIGRKDLQKGSNEIVSQFGRVSGVDAFATRFKREATLSVNQELRRIEGVRFLDMMDLSCPQPHRCEVLTSDLKPIFFGDSHFTKAGAAFMGQRLLERNLPFLEQR